MNRCLTVAALLLVAACSKQDQGSAPSNDAVAEQNASAESSQQAAVDETAEPTLEGSWSIAAIDGKPVSAAAAMAATFKGGKVTVATGCLRRAWTYSQKRNVVSFAADPGGSTNCGGGTSGEQETAYTALEKANMAIFDKGGSQATLSGYGGNLTLLRR